MISLLNGADVLNCREDACVTTTNLVNPLCETFPVCATARAPAHCSDRALTLDRLLFARAAETSSRNTVQPALYGSWHSPDQVLRLPGFRSRLVCGSSPRRQAPGRSRRDTEPPVVPVVPRRRDD